MDKLVLFLYTLLCTTTVCAQTGVTTDEQLRGAITDGAVIRLDADIVLSTELDIDNKKNVTIDLNGHKLDRGLGTATDADTYGSVIYIGVGSQLTLNDGSGNNSGVITGGYATNNGGGILNLGTLVINGGTISGNRAGLNGGGIFNFGTATISGGIISGNTAGGNGGGVFNNMALTISSCTVSDNTAETFGGGIGNGGTLAISGCTVTGNTAGTFGGGIWMSTSTTNSMQGAVTVSGNTKSGGLADNVYLASGVVITVTGGLTGSAIGVNMESAGGTFTKDYTAYNNFEPTAYFTSDNAMISVIRSSNEACLQQTAESAIYYIERSWDGENKQVVNTTKSVTRRIDFGATPVEGDYKEVPSNDDGNLHYILGGYNNNIDEYYIVRGNVENTSLEVKGKNVHLILCDNASLTLSGYNNLNDDRGPIEIHKDSKLYIHSQSYGPFMGKLSANHEYHGDYAGIGGCKDEDVPGDLEIHGGDIYAYGKAAGIGGRELKRGGTVVIWGGRVKAYGADKGITSDKGHAGIGGGFHAAGGSLTVYDGEVYAYGRGGAAGIGGGDGGFRVDGRNPSGGTVVIWGGYVEAHGDTDGSDYGAGIGGGGQSGDGADITIHGGEVYAYGGTDAAGIGGGEYGNGGKVTITGGYVYAEGGSEYGAGIGGGEEGAGANVTITGGIVVALSGNVGAGGMRGIGPGCYSDDYGSLTIGDGMMVSSWNGGEGPFPADERKSYCWYHTQARIEPCTHSSLTYTINGTGLNDTHTAHCAYCTTTFAPESHVWDDNVCTVCGAGAQTYTISVYLPDGESYGAPADYVVAEGSTFTLPAAPDAQTPEGLEFAGWLVADPTEISTFVAGDSEELLPVGNGYIINSNVSFTARYRYINISLADDAHNGEILSRYNGKQVQSITLTDRTLYKDGKWNTLCLPFDVALEGSPLEDTTVKTLVSTSFSGGTLTLNFSDNLTTIEAGKPYIVKWETPADNITGPVFENVTINTALNPVTTTTAGSAPEGTAVTFAGAYSPMFIGLERKNLLYLGAKNTLYYPNAAMTIGSCRAHFRLDGISAGDPTGLVRAFVLNLEEAADILEVSADRREKTDDAWYSLDGIRLNGKPTQRGMYINKGKTILVK